MLDAAGLAGHARVDDLAGLGAYLLGDLAAKLAALGISVPTVQYREPGQAIAWDGEQLAIAFVGLTAGQPGQPRLQVADPSTLTQYAEWDVLLLRFVPSLTDVEGELMIPDPADIDVAAVETMTDASGIYTAAVQLLIEQHQASVTVPMGVGPVTSIGPNGGLAGTMLRVSVQVM